MPACDLSLAVKIKKKSVGGGGGGGEVQQDLLEIQTVLLVTCMKTIRCTVSEDGSRKKVKEPAKSKNKT